MVTAIQGLRGTGEFDADHRPKNYRELFTLLEPNGTAPLNALLSMANSESTNDPEFKHFRDQLPDRYVTINGAIADTTTTALVIDSATENAFLVPGTILCNATTGEILRVTAYNSATSITATRNIGSTSYTIADNAVLFVAGFADTEGGTSPTAVGFDAAISSNYTQIFKTAVQVTRTLNNTFLRTGNKENELLMKALKLHMSDIERAMFFGIKAEVNGSTAQPLRYTGGLLNLISNTVDADSDPYGDGAGVITEKSFDRALVESIFAKGSNEKIAFCGPTVVAHLQELAKNRWQPSAVSGSYGVSMSRYSTFAGDLLVHLHPMFRQVPSMADAMVILDMPFVKYRYLEGADTQLQRNIQNNDFDGVKHQYLTECGLELTQGQVHTVIRNWGSVVATS